MGGCAVPQAAAGARRRYGISSLLRGSIGAVDTCCKRRGCSSRSDLLVRSRPRAGHPDRAFHAAVLLARLPDRRDLRLLAPVEDDQGPWRLDGAAPCGRPVFLLHAGRHHRRQARLCGVLHRRRHRHPQRLHRFLRRWFRKLEAAAAVGRGDELSWRVDRRAGGDRLRFVARQARFPARERLYRGERADGHDAGKAGEFRQRGALGPGNRCRVGDDFPRRGRGAAPSQPALPGGAGRPFAAGRDAGAVLEDPGALSPRAAGGHFHAGHRDCPFR